MFIIKFFGIGLIVASSAFVGFLKSCSLVQRHKKISLLLDGANTLYNYIEQGGFELDFIIKISFSKCDFLTLKNGVFLCCDSDLKQEKLLVEDFFEPLGKSAKKIECDRINNFILNLKIHLKEAESDVAQKSKVYRALGICVGITIGILLV